MTYSEEIICCIPKLLVNECWSLLGVCMDAKRDTRKELRKVRWILAL